jgi:hypothetical protein
MEVVMILKRTLAIGIVTFTLGAASLTWAGQTGRLTSLEPTKAHRAASGSAFIDARHVSVQVRGLDPNAVYTLWFVNTKPKQHETGAGQAPHMFKTYAWGNGNYSSAIREKPFGKWAMMMIVQHPNGDPMDMEQMVGTLKAMISSS